MTAAPLPQTEGKKKKKGDAGDPVADAAALKARTTLRSTATRGVT